MTKSKERNDSNDNIAIVRSSGDVFADLGIALDPAERAKLDIAVAITRSIVDRGMTQTEAARLLGTDQAKVSSITRGRLEGFSFGRLLDFLMRLGMDVDIKLTPHYPAAASAASRRGAEHSISGKRVDDDSHHGRIQVRMAG